MLVRPQPVEPAIGGGVCCDRLCLFLFVQLFPSLAASTSPTEIWVKRSTDVSGSFGKQLIGILPFLRMSPSSFSLVTDLMRISRSRSSRMCGTLSPFTVMLGCAPAHPVQDQGHSMIREVVGVTTIHGVKFSAVCGSVGVYGSATMGKRHYDTEVVISGVDHHFCVGSGIDPVG